MEKETIDRERLPHTMVQEVKNTPQKRRRSSRNKERSCLIPYAVGRRLAHSESRLRISEDAIVDALKLTEEFYLQLFRDAIPMMEHRGGLMVAKKDIDAVISTRKRVI